MTAYAGYRLPLEGHVPPTGRLLPSLVASSITPRGESAENAVILRNLYNASAHFIEPISRVQYSVARQFRILARQWREETMFSSSMTDLVSSPAYRQIIDLGPQVIPQILTELSYRPDYWFQALRELTGDNPVPDEHRGDLELMAEDWLQWGRDRSILF